MNFTKSNLLDTPQNRRDFYVVICFTTTFFALSCIGAFYVIYRTYMQWKNYDSELGFFKRSLNMNFKLPFYTSCIDLFDNSLSLMNILYTAIHANVLEEPGCRIVSMLLWGIATLNLSLYIVIAIATYFRICHDYKKFFCFGKYDYKLWLLVFILSSIFQLINMHNHGARKYWCSGKSGQIISSIILFCLIIFTLIVVLFCYISILLKLNYCSEINNTHKRATKKIISYILIFFIHWIPIIIQNLGRFLKIEHPWLYILKSSGHAMGSIGNAIVFIFNEGLSPIIRNNLDNPDNLNKQISDDKDYTLNSINVRTTLSSLKDIINEESRD